MLGALPMSTTLLRVSCILTLLLAATAAAAPCGNCHGDRVVGPGPVRFACPVCDGMGEIPDPPAAATIRESQTVAAAPGPRPAVCRIECGAGPSKDCGSGVLVEARDGRARVLTAWHVVRGNRQAITLRWPDGTSGPARVVAWDDAWDLAILSTAAPAAAPVPIAARPPAVGDRLTLAGYGPVPFRYREASGEVTQFLGPTGRHPQHMLEVRAAARQGDSGGPIFNARGEVVAVLWGSTGGLTAGSHVTEIRRMLGQPVAAAVCKDGRCER
jgi:S1-C subfamily serine protease